MRRILFLLFALSLVVGACSDGESTSTTDGAAATTLPTDPGTTAPAEEDDPTTTTTPEATTTLSDRPLAPDFTLELGDGGSYTLSEGAKPVYLVFWAEW